MIKLSNDVRAEMHRLTEQAGVRLHPTAKQAEEAAERARAAASSRKFGESALLFKAEKSAVADKPSAHPTIKIYTGRRELVGLKTVGYGVASDEVVNTGDGEPPVLVRHDPLAQIGKIEDERKVINHRANCILRGGPADGAIIYLADVRNFAFVRGDGVWLYERSQCHELRRDRSLSVFKFKGKESKGETKPDGWPAFDPGELRKVLESFGFKRRDIDAEVTAAMCRAVRSGQSIKDQAEALAQIAGDYQRQFETVVAQLDALNASPQPPTRRPGVKAPLAGLLTTVAEDHRLGRFKG